MKMSLEWLSSAPITTQPLQLMVEAPCNQAPTGAQDININIPIQEIIAINLEMNTVN